TALMNCGLLRVHRRRKRSCREKSLWRFECEGCRSPSTPQNANRSTTLRMTIAKGESGRRKDNSLNFPSEPYSEGCIGASLNYWRSCLNPIHTDGAFLDLPIRFSC